MNIYCCGCKADILARLTSGREVYPHRSDLISLPFWICDDCKNFVGCHHKSKSEKTRPLGVIATKEIKNARKHIHQLIDPAWKSGLISRGSLYKKISSVIGYQYHTADIRSIEEARKVYRVSRDIINGIN